MARTTKTRYCNHTCNSRAYKDRQKNQKIEVSNKETSQAVNSGKTDITGKDFLSIEDAVNLLPVSRRTLYRMIERGEIPIKKIGQRTVIRRSDIDSFFDLPDIIIPNNRIPDLSECYTINDMQEKFGISPAALYNLIRRESIARFTKGKFTYVVKADIERVMIRKIA